MMIRQARLQNVFLGAGLMVLLQVGSAVAEQITLNDGSRIQGDIVSMQNGVYQVKTQSMGVIQLNASQVTSVTSSSVSNAGALLAPAATNSVMTSAAASAVQSMQSTITSNAGLMSSIMQLQSNPDMQAVMSDPEVMRAVQNLDMETLANHPKIKKLMNNSQIKQIQDKLN